MVFKAVEDIFYSLIFVLLTGESLMAFELMQPESASGDSGSGFCWVF